MKKITSLVGSLLFVGFVSAQMSMMPFSEKARSIQIKPSQLVKHNPVVANGSTPFWLNFSSSANEFEGGTPAAPVSAAIKAEQKAEPIPEPSTESEEPAVIPGEAWSSGPDEDLDPPDAADPSDAEAPEASEEPDHSHS